MITNSGRPTSRPAFVVVVATSTEDCAGCHNHDNRGAQGYDQALSWRAYAGGGTVPDTAVHGESGVLLASLNSQRDHVLGILDGLSEEDLRRPVLPTGWT